MVICKYCTFSTSLLGSYTWEFWIELKIIKFKAFVEHITCLSIFEAIFLKLIKRKNSVDLLY